VIVDLHRPLILQCVDCRDRRREATRVTPYVPNVMVSCLVHERICAVDLVRNLENLAPSTRSSLLVDGPTSSVRRARHGLTPARRPASRSATGGPSRTRWRGPGWFALGHHELRTRPWRFDASPSSTRAQDPGRVGHGDGLGRHATPSPLRPPGQPAGRHRARDRTASCSSPGGARGAGVCGDQFLDRFHGWETGSCVDSFWPSCVLAGRACRTSSAGRTRTPGSSSPGERRIRR